MDISFISIKQSLNKAYRKEKVTRSEIDALKDQLSTLLNKANNNESEEHNKNLIASFLRNTWYKDSYEINTKDRKDLVIHTGRSSRDSVGVVMEVKRPSNKIEMFTENRPNVKALHELILYYLIERFQFPDSSIRKLIITNVYEWYIIDENWFDKYIFRNNRFQKDFYNWRFSGKDTKAFYEGIAKPFLDELEETIPVTFFDIRTFAKERNSDRQLIELYKVLSPAHLLKQPFANDSNSLDKRFYNELLHIIGLEEYSEGSKRLIKRALLAQDASLIENTIFLLRDSDRIYNLQNLASYGDSRADQIFNIALELCITWVNRVIFLKLLEAQLLKYHNNDRQYVFLNSQNISDFTELNNLFFNVLAERPHLRRNDLNQKYANIPYLNSSLFERTTLEKNVLQISELDNRLTMDTFGQTVLKTELGKKKKGQITSLHYLLDFLSSYDFTSEGNGEIQEENRNLINASVLGLIFEKINGYKDGSFFTPGFVTTFMSKELIDNAVVRKFNNQKGWNCDNLQSVYDLIEDKIEANQIINSLTICDPAVGSGHFLVSALNQLIAIKSQLKILLDRTGKTLRDYDIEVVNDELIITDDDGELFEYNPKSKESQRVQEALFHEKEQLIENCLFGVDLNPNSVKICRLRLWIELLKNAYYTTESNFLELETLPNIDINIKPGNSLISRFPITASIGKTSRSLNEKIAEYKRLVKRYKETNQKDEKIKVEIAIEQLKAEFRTEISNNDPIIKKLNRLTVEFYGKYDTAKLFGDKLSAAQKLDKIRLQKDIDKLKSQVADIKSNKLFTDAFEWRFEFPEILNDDGDFVGFDIIIGNPPYVPLESFDVSERKFFKEKYKLFERKFESSVLFINEGLNLLNSHGTLGYIAPITWQTGENYSKFRRFVFTEVGLRKIVNLPFNVFEDAFVDTAIYVFSKQPTNAYEIYTYDKKEKISSFIDLPFVSIQNALIAEPKYKVILNPAISYLLRKSSNISFTTLGDITISTQGLSGSNFPEVKSDNTDKYYPYLSKGNVYNYKLQIGEVYLTSLDNHISLKVFYDRKPKILIRRIINRQDRLSVAYTEEKLVFKKDINPFIPVDPNFHPKYILALLASKLVSLIYLNISAIASKDDFRQTTLSELRELPIPIISLEKQTPFVILSDYILFIKSLDEKLQINEYVPNEHVAELFESLIDGLVFELFYEKELHSERIYFIETALAQFLPIAGLDDEKKAHIVHEAYQNMRQKENPIRNSLKIFDSISTSFLGSLDKNANNQQSYY